MNEKPRIDSGNLMSYHSGDTEGETRDRLLTVKDVSGLLNVPRSYVYSLTHRKQIPHLKIGGHLRFRESAVQAWLASQEVPSVDVQTRQ